MEINDENVVLDLDTTLSYELGDILRSWSTITLDENMIALAQLDLQTGRCNRYEEMGNNAEEIIDLLLFVEGVLTGKIVVEDKDIVVYLSHVDCVARVVVRKWKKDVSKEAREGILLRVYLDEENAWDKAMECTEPIADEVL